MLQFSVTPVSEAPWPANVDRHTPVDQFMAALNREADRLFHSVKRPAVVERFLNDGDL